MARTVNSVPFSWFLTRHINSPGILHSIHWEIFNCCENCTRLERKIPIPQFMLPLLPSLWLCTRYSLCIPHSTHQNIFSCCCNTGASWHLVKADTCCWSSSYSLTILLNPETSKDLPQSWIVISHSACAILSWSYTSQRRQTIRLDRKGNYETGVAFSYITAHSISPCWHRNTALQFVWVLCFGSVIIRFKDK